MVEVHGGKYSHATGANPESNALPRSSPQAEQTCGAASAAISATAGRSASTCNWKSPTPNDVTLTLNGQWRTFYFMPATPGFLNFWYTPAYTPEPGFFGALAATVTVAMISCSNASIDFIGQTATLCPRS
jgi:hypothetical protein